MTQDPSYEETCQFALTAESIVINKEINGEKQLTLAAVSVDKDLTKELAHKETQIELIKQQITLFKEQNKNSTNSQEIKTQETTVAVVNSHNPKFSSDNRPSRRNSQVRFSDNNQRSRENSFSRSQSQGIGHSNQNTRGPSKERYPQNGNTFNNTQFNNQPRRYNQPS